MPQQPPGNRTGPEAHAAHIRRVEHGHGNPRQPLRQHHVVLAGRQDGALVGVRGGAFVRGDEPGPQLHARVAEFQRPREFARCPHPPRAHDRDPQVSHLVQ